MIYYLERAGVLWKNFKGFAVGVTDRIREAAAALAEKHRRPMIYLPSSRTNKEQVALQIKARQPVRSGLVAVLSCVEPCRTWFVRGNRATKKLELKLQWGKCLHLYYYLVHEQVGWLSVRLQTWFPFLFQVCLNGREWLARQMDAAGLAYRREDNCFTWVADTARAQALLDEQHRTDWPKLMTPLVQLCHPLHAEITKPIERDYYWTAAETEYATDVMFRERAALERIYPALVHHAVMSFGSEQVLRFMGRPRGAHGSDEVQTDRRRGPDGVRIKHWLNKNSLKAYDKGTVFRTEVTINQPKDFRIWRGPENEPDGRKQWRILRRSVADLHRRAQVSHAGTDRYLTALAAVHVTTPLAQEAVTVCRPVRDEGRRYRALNPFAESDAQLLEAINRGEFAMNGFRNRDIRSKLYESTEDPAQVRRQMAAIGRRLRLLWAHGLITKVSKTHRYVLSQKGHRIVTAMLAARQASIEKLTAFAA
ncbi:MAG: hypothetical protein C5B50_06190 [Verrucomicrobia bacterium]|nr:MAG: hypothetical protein C5B50_06190 [Verrucomicrobiota bacterium]